MLRRETHTEILQNSLQADSLYDRCKYCKTTHMQQLPIQIAIVQLRLRSGIGAAYHNSRVSNCDQAQLPSLQVFAHVQNIPSMYNRWRAYMVTERISANAKLVHGCVLLCVRPFLCPFKCQQSLQASGACIFHLVARPVHITALLALLSADFFVMRVIGLHRYHFEFVCGRVSRMWLGTHIVK